MEHPWRINPILTQAAPSADTPGMDIPGADTPGMDTPGMDTPGMDTPGMDTPGADTPGAEAIDAPQNPVLEQPAQGCKKTPMHARTPLQAMLAGLTWFAVYLLVRLVIDLPFSLFVAMRSVLAVGTADLELLMQDMLLRARHGGLALTAVINAATLITFFLILRARKAPVLASLGIRRVPFSTILPLVPLGLALNVLLSAAFALLPQKWLSAYLEASNALLPDGFSVFSALIVAVLAPLTEEVLFRGLVYTRFRSGMRAWLALLLSSALFGFMHMQPVWIVYAACIGALLCAAMERYNTLLAPILLHMSFNAGSMLVPLLQNVPALPILLFALGACFLLARRIFFSSRQKSA